jgi:hypothetical protein
MNSGLMRFEFKEGDVIFRFALEFRNERLEFSVFDDIGVKDIPDQPLIPSP